jgi:hypothetical protein
MNEHLADEVIVNLCFALSRNLDMIPGLLEWLRELGEQILKRRSLLLLKFMLDLLGRRMLFNHFPERCASREIRYHVEQTFYVVAISVDQLVIIVDNRTEIWCFTQLFV